MVYMIFVPCRFECQYTVTWPQCPPNYQLIYDRCYYRNPSYNNNYASNCPKGKSSHVLLLIRFTLQLQSIF